MTRSPGQLAAVLFDMDGTLIDSERLWQQAIEDVARQLGGTISEATRVRMVGSGMDESIRLMLEDLPVDTAPAVVHEMIDTAIAGLFHTSLQWRPGAEELLTAVRAAGIRAALVTATYRHLTDIALRTIGAHHFDALVCGDDVQRSKPDPEPYQRALNLLDVAAHHAVAIEDSPAGSSSALAAGVATIGVPLEVPLTPREGLTLVNTLEEVSVDTLQRLIASATA